MEGFSTAWPLCVASCRLVLKGAFILSVPSDERLCLTNCGCCFLVGCLRVLLVLILIRITEDQV